MTSQRLFPLPFLQPYTAIGPLFLPVLSNCPHSSPRALHSDPRGPTTGKLTAPPLWLLLHFLLVYPPMIIFQSCLTWCYVSEEQALTATMFFSLSRQQSDYQFKKGTYWGAFDSELYCHIFAACTSFSCNLCSVPSHPTTASQSSCPQLLPAVFNHLSTAAPPPPINPKPTYLDIHPSVNVPIPKGVDKQGRSILYQAGRMVCNSFNHLGPTLSNCHLLHTCSFSGGAHARKSCPHNPTTPADR